MTDATQVQGVEYFLNIDYLALGTVERRAWGKHKVCSIP